MQTYLCCFCVIVTILIIEATSIAILNSYIPEGLFCLCQLHSLFLLLTNYASLFVASSSSVRLFGDASDFLSCLPSQRFNSVLSHARMYKYIYEFHSKRLLYAYALYM